MSGEKKSAVITFKAEEELLAALEKIPNKSHFIRSAVLNALEESCPLCGGRGFLTAQQRKHWTEFVRTHTLHRCGKCDGFSIECRSLSPRAKSTSLLDPPSRKEKEKKTK